MAFADCLHWMSVVFATVPSWSTHLSAKRLACQEFTHRTTQLFPFPWRNFAKHTVFLYSMCVCVCIVCTAGTSGWVCEKRVGEGDEGVMQ